MYVGSLPTASNRARYVQTFQVFDKDTGEPVDLTDINIAFAIREPRSCTPLLTVTDDDGIDVIDADEGVFVVTFTKTQMNTLCAKQYDVGCTITDDDDDEEADQFIIGTLTVLDGVVSRNT